MRFLSIEVENLLAYEGKSTVKFPTDPGTRNVVLIWGRNGMGKTSFLNALRILFTGVEDKENRRMGLKLAANERQFILGDGGQWLGLINSKALERARRARNRVTARVEAKWTEGDRTFRAERSWTTDGATYEHRLVLDDGEDRLLGEPASERLEEILPKDFIEFFFFDGEEVKSLAEDIGRKAVDVDRLMRLTFVNELAGAANNVANQRLKKNLEKDILATIEDTERELARGRRSEKAARDELEDLEVNISEAESENQQLQIRRENLGSGASSAQLDDLEERRRATQQELREAIEEVASTIPALVPFYANLGLVSEALRVVDARLKAAGTAEAVVLRTVKDELPGWLEGSAVKLTTEQRSLLCRELSDHLDKLRSGAVDEGLFAGLDLERAERLRSLLLRWDIDGPTRRDLHASQLERAHRLQLQLEQLNDAIMRVEAGSQVSLEEYRRVVTRLEELQVQLAEWNQRKGQLIERATAAASEVERLDKELKDLYRTQEKVNKGAAEARFIRSVSKTLNDLREALRRQVKSRLERGINQRFHELTVGYGLVARIELTDVYTMNFLDSAGRPVGRASLSSGIKQLAATALLWAMKDVSGRDIPVVIDTPLGRIDRENQNNLLLNYYPRISHQVVVLPTNSEIDANKLAALEPAVARHFTIQNEEGNGARIIEDKSLVVAA